MNKMYVLSPPPPLIILSTHRLFAGPVELVEAAVSLGVFEALRGIFKCVLLHDSLLTRGTVPPPTRPFSPLRCHHWWMQSNQIGGLT